MSILSARGIKKSYGARTLFADVELTIEPGDRIGVVGVNGTGKSTLLRIFAGEEPADEGVLERGRGMSILHLSQEPVLDETQTISACVAAGMQAWSEANAAYEALCSRVSAGEDNLMHEQQDALELLEHLGGFDRAHEADAVIEKLGLRDPSRLVSDLSGGEKRRVALARILVARPDMAILDEPTNHLDAETIEWLERYLMEDFKGAILFVTHDRYVLDAVSTRIVELDRGTLERYKGNYGDYLLAKAERMALEERTEARRLNLVRRETAWLRRGAKARSTKQKARIDRANDLIANVGPAARGDVELAGAAASRLGGTILDVENVTLEAHGQVFVRGLSVLLTEGKRIGIVGRNGTGKTTFLRLVAGDFEPTSGRVVRGKNTRIAYFDQARAQLEDNWTVFENVAEREGGQSGPVLTAEGPVEMRSYLERFLFDPHAQRQKVSSLSGGERARVALAKLLKGNANMLLLDEPTNDLDTHTLGALEDMLSVFPGCVLFVSHDRYFLNSVATAILSVDPDTKTATLYEGDYDFYLQRRLAEKAEARASVRPSKLPAAKGNDKAAPSQREAPVSSMPGFTVSPNKNAPAEAPKAQGKALKSKLTYAERIELDGLFANIEKVEAEAAKHEAELADGQIFVKEPARAKTVQLAWDRARGDAQRLTERWEELEAKKDAP